MPPERRSLLERNILRRGKGALLANAASRARWTAILGALRELLAARATTRAYMWFDQKYICRTTFSQRSDRMSMAHSLEVRPPFLDHRIVEFAASLAGAIQDSRLAAESRFCKELMKGKLPPAILQRKKSGLRHSGARMVARAAARVC